MRYIFLHSNDKCGDEWIEEFDDKQEALDIAQRDWQNMCEYDKAHTKEHYVLESVNPFEGAPDHYDGRIIRDWMEEV